MRPLSITLEGFSAYRERNTISFDGVDFFSLSGPTGAGKSSLIDAMIFSLFGRIPRLGGSQVAPIISAGAERARVSMEFAVGDQAYTVSRQVLRTKTGANTNEARLEHGTDVMASGADEVTKSVEDLLALRYEDFTKTVVLPQGEFARFLTATKAERQALLRKLLDLDVYSEVRGLARIKAAAAEERGAQAGARLGSLQIPDEHSILAARERMTQLDAMAERLGDLEKDLQAVEAVAAASAALVGGLEGDLLRLESIQPPDNLEMLDEATNRARDAFEDLEKRREQFKADLDGANLVLEALPSGESLGSHARTYTRLAEVDVRLTEIDVAGAEATTNDALAALETATKTHERVSAELTLARVSHAAHALRAVLKIGEPCPVCQTPVTALPDGEGDPDLARLDEAVQEASAGVVAARGTLEEARSQSAVVMATRIEVETQRSVLMADLAEAPPIDTLQDQMRALEAAKSLVEEKRRARDEVDVLLATTRREMEDAAEAFRSIGRALMAARENVADLQPPLPESDNALIQWKELMGWVELTSQQSRARHDEAVTAAGVAALDAAQAREGLIAILQVIGVEGAPPFAGPLAREQERARQSVKELDEAVALAVDLASTIAEAEASAAVAHSLAAHLRADGFERWLMAGAVADLVTGANDLLAQLSSGGFSLSADDDGGFAIVDHRNADETRLVSTLSGGETFLVALALALSLAETLSAGVGSGLDAIFLDEGFGTLDEESLDTVASVLEELAGRGLMVGIVTHVKELAARATVRFEVRREPSGSVVEVTS
jgi:exonuclease SbcC